MYTGCAGKTVRSLENVHLGAQVRSGQGAIQIHVYLYLYLPESRGKGKGICNKKQIYTLPDTEIQLATLL